MPSTVIAGFEYDSAALVLRVRFLSGAVYEYLGVPPELYEAMKTYREKGVFLNKFIKAKYAFRKLS